MKPKISKLSKLAELSSPLCKIPKHAELVCGNRCLCERSENDERVLMSKQLGYENMIGVSDRRI